MSDFLLQCYYAAWPGIRTCMASLEGYRLRWQRYGHDSEELVEAILERDHWSRRRWHEWQREKLAWTLHRAAKHIPYYQALWAARRAKGDRSSHSYLENWPYLEKDELRRNSREFVADDRSIRGLRETVTSGTTGQPIHFWYGPQTDRTWWALCEARWRRWNGVSRRDRWALLAGRLVVPVERRDPPYWVWNRGLNQLYLSAYHLLPRALPRYLDAIERHGVTYLWGHSAALHALAREAQRQDRRMHMRVALTTAEPLYPFQRQTIEAAFDCPVRETYGMAEMAAAASECAAGGMHYWPELGWVEFLPLGPSGDVAEIVVTTILNPDMPLIRYRTGDLVHLQSTATPCPCGRALPLLGKIVGRTSDILYTADGSPIGPAAAEVIFDAEVGLQEAQLIQQDFRRVLVRYVAPTGSAADVERVLARRITARFGDVSVAFERVAAIPRGPHGKFRAAVCEIPRERRRPFEMPPTAMGGPVQANSI